MSYSIGLLALGSRTTAFYVDYLNTQHQQNTTLDSGYPLVIVNTDFSTLNAHLPNNFEQLEPLVVHYLKQFDGVQRLIIPNVTLHETIDRLSHKGQGDERIVHPVTQLLQRLKQDNIKEVMLVGSEYTMLAPYLPQQLAAQNINVVSPKAKDRASIDALRKKVYERIESAEEVLAYRELIASYTQQTAVLIACTELSLVLTGGEVNVYDMTRIQLEQSLHAEHL